MKKPIKLKKKDVVNALNEHAFVPNEALSILGAGKAFVSKEGKIIFIFEDGKGILYESIEILNAMLDKAKGKVESMNIFNSKSNCEDFIQNIDQLCESIYEIYKIQNGELDYSEKSLNTLEYSIKKIGYSKCTRPTYIKPLIAYVGEVIRAKVENGIWKLLGTSDKSCEPIIVDGYEKIYQPYFIVKNELELGSQGSIRGAVNGITNQLKG